MAFSRMFPSSPNAKPRAANPSGDHRRFGVPLSIVLLQLFHKAPLHYTFLYRYIERSVEGVELILCCCAVRALGAKFVQSLLERRAFQSASHREVIPLFLRIGGAEMLLLCP
jgi:hypothetical protein